MSGLRTLNAWCYNGCESRAYAPWDCCRECLIKEIDAEHDRFVTQSVTSVDPDSRDPMSLGTEPEGDVLDSFWEKEENTKYDF